jgi:hypothetical protein
MAKGQIDHVFVLGGLAVVVHVDFVLDLQYFLALLDEPLQVVKALLRPDLIQDGAEEQFQVLSQRLVMTVGVCKQSAMPLVQKVKQEC